jgi:hypothetical protein
MLNKETEMYIILWIGPIPQKKSRTFHFFKQEETIISDEREKTKNKYDKIVEYFKKRTNDEYFKKRNMNEGKRVLAQLVSLVKYIRTILNICTLVSKIY